MLCRICRQPAFDRLNPYSPQLPTGEQPYSTKRAGPSDAEILTITKIARARVEREAVTLGKYEVRDQRLTQQIEAQRNSVAAIEVALAKQQISEEIARSHTRARLASVNGSYGFGHFDR